MSYAEDLATQRKVVRSFEVLLGLLGDALCSAAIRITVGRVLGMESYLEKDFEKLLRETLRIAEKERMRLDLMLRDSHTLLWLEQH